jgi:hypothetical protein
VFVFAGTCLATLGCLLSNVVEFYAKAGHGLFLHYTGKQLKTLCAVDHTPKVLTPAAHVKMLQYRKVMVFKKSFPVFLTARASALKFIHGALK